jgi:outer membrane protein OmpA-like peptidoglycan-associated protein
VSNPDVKDSVAKIPLTHGLTIVTTLHFSGGDRESVETLDEVSPAGVRYGWRFVEVHETGDTIRREYTRFVSAADLASARRLHFYGSTEGPAEHPSYTWRSLSTAVYQRLLAAGSDSFQIMSLARPGEFGGGFGDLGIAPFHRNSEAPVRWRGTLTLSSTTPQPFPLLMGGRRVVVPALHMRGRFQARGERWEPEIWVLADSAHPLLLKVVGSHATTENVLQVVRVDLPGGKVMEGQREPESIEDALATTCRAELPGIYFAFASAELQPASAPAMANVAKLIAGHPEWIFSIEGHTDSIGDFASNLALSKRRAHSVKAKLVELHQIDSKRLHAEGYGAFRPREPNTTIEGRARNRRVELVRDCDHQRGR